MGEARAAPPSRTLLVDRMHPLKQPRTISAQTVVVVLIRQERLESADAVGGLEGELRRDEHVIPEHPTRGWDRVLSENIEVIEGVE